jgi:hypothetical protein
MNQNDIRDYVRVWENNLEEPIPERVSYFIKPVNHEVVKIGTTTDVQRRLEGLQCGWYEELRLVAVTSMEESELHQRFSKYWIRGEWFEYSEEIKEFVKQLFEAVLAKDNGFSIKSDELTGYRKANCGYEDEEAFKKGETERGSVVAEAMSSIITDNFYKNPKLAKKLKHWREHKRIEAEKVEKKMLAARESWEWDKCNTGEGREASLERNLRREEKIEMNTVALRLKKAMPFPKAEYGPRGWDGSPYPYCKNDHRLI